MSFTKKAFDLLEGLEQDNSKEWFDSHRDEVKAYLQEPFAEMLETVTSKLKRLTFPLKGGKQTMFRMHRDIRFSKDKSPYNTHVSGLLTESGGKSEDLALVYVQLDKNGGFIASGFYQLETKVLRRIRDQILQQSSRFEKIVNKLDKAGYEFMNDAKLKSMPQGYSEYSEHPLAEYLKLKSLVLNQQQLKAAWMEGSIVDEIVKFAKASTDLIIFGTEAIKTGDKTPNQNGA